MFFCTFVSPCLWTSSREQSKIRIWTEIARLWLWMSLFLIDFPSFLCLLSVPEWGSEWSLTKFLQKMPKKSPKMPKMSYLTGSTERVTFECNFMPFTKQPSNWMSDSMNGVSNKSSWSKESNKTETNTVWADQVDKNPVQSRKIA